jgi:tetratricopeptide (TPR) repeat protein
MGDIIVQAQKACEAGDFNAALRLLRPFAKGPRRPDVDRLLCTCYQRLGQYEAALPHAQFWVDSECKRSPQRSEALKELCLIQQGLKAFAAARKPMMDAVSILDDLGLEQSAQYGSMLSVLGDLNCAQQRHKEALAVYDKAKGILAQHKEAEYWAVLAKAAKCHAHCLQGNEAMALGRLWVEGVRSLRTGYHPQHASSLREFAMLCVELKQYEEAIARLEESFCIFQKLYGDQDTRTAEALQVLTCVRCASQYADALASTPQLARAVVAFELGHYKPAVSTLAMLLSGSTLTMHQEDVALECLIIWCWVLGESRAPFVQQCVEQVHHRQLKAKALVALCISHVNLKAFRAAQTAISEALAIAVELGLEQSPLHGLILVGMADLKVQQGLREEAVALYREAKAISGGENGGLILLALGQCYFGLRQLSNATACFQEAIKHSRLDFLVGNKGAVVYPIALIRMGMIDPYVPLCNEGIASLRSRNHHPRLLVQLSTLLGRARHPPKLKEAAMEFTACNFQGAIASLRPLLLPHSTLSPEDELWAQELVGECYSRLSKFENALPHLQRLLALQQVHNPNSDAHVHALRLLGDSHLQLGAFAVAHTLYGEAVSMMEELGSPDMHVMLGMSQVYFREGRYQEALVALDKALSGAAEPEESLEVFSLAGICHAGLEHWDQAAACFSDCLLLAHHVSGDAEYVFLLTEMAAAFSNGQRYEESLSYLEMAMAFCQQSFGPHHQDTVAVCRQHALIKDEARRHAIIKEDARRERESAVCHQCGVNPSTLVCPCYRAWYCAIECQQKHWAVHKARCNVCLFCDVAQVVVKRCSRCKTARYCDNSTCSLAHWKEHKKTCVAPAKAAE